ncbi:MAG: metal ABC transporter ATP-binding protein [Simkaniaceae bacterium]
MSKAALQFIDLSVLYDGGYALFNINCTLPEKQMIAIVGPNGAGKSTLIKSAISLIRPKQGRVEFFGLPYKKIKEKIAYIPQRGSIDWDFPITAFEVVLMGRFGRLGPLRWPRRSDKEAAQRIMERLKIWDLAERQISKLSGGQQQRLFLARALLQEADLYFLDEPFQGIDKASESMLFDLFKELKSEGKTLIVVHHDLNTLEAHFDHLLLLNKRLIASGPIEKTFTPENINRCYGQEVQIFIEAARLKQEKTKGESL